MSRIGRRGALALLAGGAASAAAFGIAKARSSHHHGPSAALPIPIAARPFADLMPGSQETRFGELEFLGGLELSTAEKSFGGLSGLSISPDGRRILALSDHGYWVAATLESEGGRPSGVSDAQIAPMLGPRGRPLPKSRRYDAESLCVAGGVAYVGLEQVHEVLRFPIGQDGLAAWGEPISVPPGVKTLPANKGLEALGMPTAGPYAGNLIAIAERSANGEDTPTKGFFITGPQGGFTVARHGDFDITDLAFLPGGDMLLLERRFGFLSGFAMRIRRIDGRSLRPGAQLDGPTLVMLDRSSRVDNMEGIAIHRDASGLVVTLVSDDNYFFLQKAVLLQFRLNAGASA